MAAKKKSNKPATGKTLVTLYLSKEEHELFKKGAKQIGLSLSKYFAHLARRELLNENNDLRLYTETEEIRERIRTAIKKSKEVFK